MRETPSPRYRERLFVPVRWWILGGLLVMSLWLALVVALPEPAAWIIGCLAAALLAALLWGYGDARLEVADGWFRAGRARIQAAHLGPAEALDAERTRRLLGVDADARAYLLLRAYVKRAVRVEITDPDDPAPYWLVSSRRPEELAAALTALRDARPAG